MMPASRSADSLLSLALLSLAMAAVPASLYAATTDMPSPYPVRQAQTQEEYEQQLREYQQALVSQEARLKIEAFHRAVNDLDRGTITASLCYPVRIMFRDKQINVEDKATFLQYFEAVFTPRFILTLGKIDWTPSVIGDKGITIGSGQVWFDMNGCVVTFNNNAYVM